VTVSGATAQVEQALGVTINDYRRNDGSVFYANTSAASVPVGLDIQTITGLSTFERAAAAGRTRDVPAKGYQPNDLRRAYNISAGLVGGASGQVIGLTLWGGSIQQSDFSTYASNTGTPALVIGQSGADGIDFIGVDNNPMNDTSSKTIQETAQDAETAHGVAPSSHLKFWLAPCDGSAGCKFGTTTGLEDAISAAANDPAVHIVSDSWIFFNINSASDPIVQTIDNSLQRAVAGGITFYFASGDGGSKSACGGGAPPCPPAYPASSRYAVAVGGTDLQTNSDSTYKGETGWNDAKGSTGGECATFFTRPSWQTNVTAATHNGLPCTGRAVPDVAADASYTSPVYIVAQGNEYTFYGTSVAAPIWAGMTADINTALVLQRGIKGSRLKATQDGG